MENELVTNYNAEKVKALLTVLNYDENAKELCRCMSHLVLLNFANEHGILLNSEMWEEALFEHLNIQEKPRIEKAISSLRQYLNMLPNGVIRETCTKLVAFIESEIKQKQENK
jgi:hypothetical protein